jgi:hypothetical protein
LVCAVILASLAGSAGHVAAASLVGAGRIGGDARDLVASIARDPSGAIYLTGSFAGTADFDPGPGSAALTSAGNLDAFVAKVDQSGSLVWARRLGGPLTDQGASVVADASGVYVAGTFEGTADLDPGPGTLDGVSQGSTDVFLVRLDGDGNLVWARSFGGTVNESATALALAGGALFLVGDFRGTVDLDPGAGVASATSANGATDIYVTKFDLAGTLVWAKTVTGSQNDFSQGIASDGATVYVTGIFTGTVDFDPGPGTASLTSTQDSPDAFILRLDADGHFVWARSIGGPGLEASSDIAIDGSGVYLTGYFAGTVDFDPGSGTVALTSAGSVDTFLMKLDPSGNLVWARRFGDVADDVPFALAVNTSGVYVTGQFGGTVDFDPGAGSFSLTADGPADAFLTRLTPAGDFVTAYRLGGAGSDSSLALALSGSTAYLAGVFEKTADFDPGPGTAPLTSAGFTDIFLSIVAADPEPPVAVADSYAVDAGTTLTVPARGVLANDAGPGGSNASLQAVLVGPPSRGTLDLRADGSFRYVPHTGVVGGDQFTYRATAGAVSSGPVTVTLTITPTACGPRPPARITTAASGGRLRVTVTASPLGTGAANQIQELRFLAGRSNGVVTINGATIAATGEVVVPITAPSATFEVGRVTPGLATTVPFVVVDGCGPWQTFVGGGPTAF